MNQRRNTRKDAPGPKVDVDALRGIVNPRRGPGENPRRGIVGDPRPWPVDQETPTGGQELTETPTGGQELQERVEDPLRGVLALATAALAPNSRTAYKRAVERLAQSLDGQELNDQTLAAHFLDLHGRGLAPASIAIVPAAVRYYARAHGSSTAHGGSAVETGAAAASGGHGTGNAGGDPIGPLTKAALKIIRREGRGRGRGQASGIKWEQADATAAVAASGGHGTGNAGQDVGNPPGGLAGLRDAAIIAVMSDCLLRVSELAALDVQDVVFDADGSGRVHVRASKTDQEGKGETLYAGLPTAARVQAWLGATQVQDGPLFRRIRRGGHVQASRLTARAVADIVKKRAQDAGIDPSGVSGHSLRVGAAQSLAAAGAGVVEMQTAGRWKSPDMPGRYARKQLAAKGAVAKLRHGK